MRDTPEVIKQQQSQMKSVTALKSVPSGTGTRPKSGSPKTPISAAPGDKKSNKPKPLNLHNMAVTTAAAATSIGESKPVYSRPRQPSLTVSDFEKKDVEVTLLPAISQDGSVTDIKQAVDASVNAVMKPSASGQTAASSKETPLASSSSITSITQSIMQSFSVAAKQMNRARSGSTNTFLSEMKSDSSRDSLMVHQQQHAWRMHFNSVRPGHDPFQTHSVPAVEQPNPFELFDRLTEPRDCPWRSPLVTDEFYLLDLFYNGSLEQGSQLLAYAKFKSDLSLMSHEEQETLLSPDGDAQGNLSSSFSSLSLTRNLSRNLSGSDQGQLNVTSNGMQRNPSSEMSGSMPSMAAPRLPKKTIRLLKPDDKEAMVTLFRTIPKYNSCSTLFTVDGTLYQPAVTPMQQANTLKAIAHAIMSHVDRTYVLHKELTAFEHRYKGTTKYSHRVFKSENLLSEKLFPIWSVRRLPEEVLKHPFIMQAPTLQEVYTFLKQIFSAADLCTEVGIISLIYLERMLHSTHISLHGINVFRSILGAVMLASKIWDDQAVWNVDFKSIMPDLNLQDLNRLECWWLKKLEYNVRVKRAEYARYWFAIRELSERLSGVKVGQVKMMIRAKSDWHMNHDGTPLPSSGQPLSPIAATPLDVNTQNNSLVVDSGTMRTSKSHSHLGNTLISSTLVPKPLTEQDMKKISVSTLNARLRTSNSQSLYETLNDNSENGGLRHGASGGMDLSPKKSSIESVEEEPKAAQEKMKPTWGAAHLRRSKSDHFYEHQAPPASVL